MGDVAKGIITVEDDSNNILRIHVFEKDIVCNLAKEKSRINPIVQKWAGYAIDSRMMENLPIGEKATSVVRRVECTRVIHVTDPDLKKPLFFPNTPFRGFTTVT